MEQDVLKAICTIIPNVVTQNIPVKLTFKNYTVKIIIRYKYLEYHHELVMTPLINHIPMHITNRIVTIDNPNKHTHIVVHYRLQFDNDKQPISQLQRLPAKIELSDGKYRIELIKMVLFGRIWIQYGQWIQYIEIKSKEPAVIISRKTNKDNQKIFHHYETTGYHRKSINQFTYHEKKEEGSNYHNNSIYYNHYRNSPNHHNDYTKRPPPRCSRH